MAVSDEQWDAAINAVDRRPIFSFLADWDRDGHQNPLSDLSAIVKEFTVTREIAGELPPEVGLFEGYITANTSVTLGGSWVTQTAETVPTFPRNYVSAPAPSLDATDWQVADGATIAGGYPTTAAVTGMDRPSAFRVVATPDPADQSVAVLSPRTANVVQPGQRWSGRLQWRCSVTYARAQLFMQWFTASGVYLGGTAVDLPSAAGAVVTSAAVVGDAPWGTACCDVAVRVYGIPSTGQVTLDATAARIDHVDDWSLPYFDGDSLAGWSWDGQPGYSTSTQRHTMLAAGQDIATVLSPYRADSPLTRDARPTLQTPITIDTGFATDAGDRLDRRFTGTIATISPKSSDREVVVSGLDPAARLHSPVTLPAVGMDTLIMAAQGPIAYRSQINTQWLIDYVLRCNGYFASPPPRDDALLSVTGHGSMIPEIGSGGAPEEWYVRNTPDGVWMDTGHPFNMLYPIDFGPEGTWWLSSAVTVAAATGIGFSAWVLMYAGAPGYDWQQFYMRISADLTIYYKMGIRADGMPFVGIQNGTDSFLSVPPSFTIPSKDTWMFIGAHIKFSEYTMVVTWRINGVTSVDTVIITRRYGDWRPDPFVYYTFRRPMTNIQLWYTPVAPEGGPWQGEVWESQADIDPGSNLLTGIPELLAVDSLSVIKDVSAAELASFGISQEGRPQWRTRRGDAARGREPVGETITADRNLSDLVATLDEATIRNVVTVKSRAQMVTDWQDVFTPSLATEFDVDAFSTSIFQIDLPSNCYRLPEWGHGGGGTLPEAGFGFVYYMSTDDWGNDALTNAAKHMIRVIMTRVDNPTVIVSGGGYAANMRVYRVSPWSALLVIINNNDFAIRFGTPQTLNTSTGLLNQDAQPGLRIPGRLVEASPDQVTVVSDQGSIATYGESTYEVAGDNTYRQWPAALADIAGGVLAFTAHPLPVLDVLDVPHDPRRRLNQIIRLADPAGLGSVLCRIVGVTTTYSAQGATDHVTVRPIAPPGLGLTDDPDLGLADDTIIAA